MRDFGVYFNFLRSKEEEKIKEAEVRIESINVAEERYNSADLRNDKLEAKRAIEGLLAKNSGFISPIVFFKSLVNNSEIGREFDGVNSKEVELIAGVDGISLINEVPNKKEVSNIVNSSSNKSKPKFGRLSKYFFRFLLIAFLIGIIPGTILYLLVYGFLFLAFGGVYVYYALAGLIILTLLVVIFLPKIKAFFRAANGKGRSFLKTEVVPNRSTKFLLKFIVYPIFFLFFLGFVLGLLAEYNIYLF